MASRSHRGRGIGSFSARGTGSASNWRGRGSGQGGYALVPAANPGPSTSTSLAGNQSSRAPNSQNPPHPKPHLTHFLALPLGHHERLRQRMTAFTTALLIDPSIPGLDQSIVVSPRRMHLTLGVMALDSSLSSGGGRNVREAGSPRTLEAAIQLLHSLKPRIMDILAHRKLQVEMTRVDIMKPERGSLDRAHVFWAGPPETGEEVVRLKAVCDLVHNAFKDAGFLVDEGRPLKLHCTVLNTTYRKPRGRRTPFSYTALLNSSAFRAIEHVSPSSATTSQADPGRGRSPIPVDLGIWAVDEVQICEMGSWGPEGEYVCVGRCRLD